jgi:hypothetical protein
MQFEGKLVNSTLVKLIAYNSEKGILRLIFNDLRGYEYLKIPYSVYLALMNAESIGQAYWKVVRSSYKFHRKIESDESKQLLELFMQSQPIKVIFNN